MSTLGSRVFSALVILIFLKRTKQQIRIDRYFVKPDFPVISKILGIGIPTGIENGMFQFGKLAIQSSVSTLGTAAIAAVKPLTVISGMEADVALLAIHLSVFVHIIKPFAWSWSFIPAYGMRAAGDVKFSMTLSSITMWTCRVALTTFLIRGMGTGPIGVWIGMSTDWAIRSVLFIIRFRSGRWLRHKITN